MSYKIGDILADISRRLSKIIDNHLFIIFFFVFIIIFGTCGIWIETLTSNNINWVTFSNKFNTLALLTFSAPLLAVAIFDSVVRLALKIENDSKSIDASLIAWFALLSIILFVGISILFYMGSKSGSEYSVYSSAAWSLVLIYWALVNIDNPSYQSPGKPEAPTGTDDVAQLRRS